MIAQEAELSLVDFKNSVEFQVKVLKEQYNPKESITVEDLCLILESIVADLP